MKTTNADELAIEKSFILDVNIIFSGVLSKKEIYRRLFSEFVLYTPDFALIELSKYREVILKKSPKINEEDLKNFTLFIFSKLVVIPDYLISYESYCKAAKLVESIDKKDVAYVALAVEFDMPLLTRDKALFEGLMAQRFENIIMFDDLIRELSG